MDNTTLRTKLAELVATSPVVAGDVSSRRDQQVADAVNALGARQPIKLMLGLKGIRSVLGSHEGRIFVQTLRSIAAMHTALPEAHPAYDDVWWLNEVMPDLAAGGEGVDVGDPSTRAVLRALAGPLGAALAASLPAGLGITSAHCDALEAASSQADLVTVAQVSNILNEGL